jgi:hypothetical protein
MKILLVIFFTLANSFTFNQSSDALKKLSTANARYLAADKKAKQARAIIEECFKSNRLEAIKRCANDAGFIASNAGVYARKAEVIANEVKQSKDVCPYAKYLAEKAEDYFSQAHQLFSDAYTELSKIYASDSVANDIRGATPHLQVAIGLLSDGTYRLDIAKDKLNETIAAIKDNCQKKY